MRRAKRSLPALTSMFLVALVITLIAFPSVGDAIRGIVGSVFGGKTLLGILGGVASIIGIISALVWVYQKLFQRAGTASQATPVTEQSSQTNERTEAVHRLVAETNEVAQRVSDFAAEYDRRSPFKVQPGEAFRMDFESPEYQADQQRKTEKYDALVDEMRERYRVELRPAVTRVRGALVEQGITDTQLDEIYRQPKNDKALDNIAHLLWDMAGRLERRS